MKFWALIHGLRPRGGRGFRPYIALLCIVFASATCFALDREAFSISKYDLQLQVEPEQHRLGVRGKITLRNDTSTAQQVAVLQISSSLGWRAIKAGDKPVQFVTQPYASDIDHTGGLSEAIVTFPQAVVSHGAIDLDIAYEGVVELDATRLTRIGTPDELARNSDWDQISPTFSAVRGVGYVAWYPIETDVANLSEGSSLFEVLARWKARQSSSKMHVHINVSKDDEELQKLIVNEASCKVTYEQMGRASLYTADCTYQALGSVVPTFVIGSYGAINRRSITVHNLATHAVAGETYADAADKLTPLITEWFGAPRQKIQIADLPDSDDAPFESGGFLLTSLANPDSTRAGLAVAHQLTHASFISPRPWIEEGLAHFAQALYLEHEKGRQAALAYIGAHRSALTQIEPSGAVPHSEDAANNSLVNTVNDELYRSKAMCVWWMLRDMIGDAALKKALAAYRPEQDKDPSYMPRLISAQTPHDLEWFFDDWVYRDRGLPEFKVESAFSRKTLNNSFILTVTIDNVGSAGAEVPVTVKFDGGEITKRLEGRAKEKATIRIESPAAAQEIVVNDGSVPETNASNNYFKVEPAKE